jgi:protein-S-isoprenylcysteine O-methyltransferase Ste14
VLAGLSLALGLRFAIVFTVLFIFATMFRVSSRDRVMAEKYGQPYAAYSRSCKKLIPGLW